MSSLIPSEKYSCSGSPLILAKGRTQIATPGRTSALRPSTAAPPSGRRTKTCTALNALDRMVAEIIECARDLPGHVVANSCRQRDPADRGDCLQPRCDSDAFAVDIVAFDNDVAQIDADAVEDAPSLGAISLGASGRLLDRKRAVDGGDDAPELDERAVAHELDEAPSVGRQTRIEDPAPFDHQPFERPGLVGLHHSAVASDVRRKYRGQPALHQSAPERRSAAMLTPWINVLRSGEAKYCGFGLVAQP